MNCRRNWINSSLNRVYRQRWTRGSDLSVHWCVKPRLMRRVVSILFGLYRRRKFITGFRRRGGLLYFNFKRCLWLTMLGRVSYGLTLAAFVRAFGIVGCADIYRWALMIGLQLLTVIRVSVELCFVVTFFWDIKISLPWRQWIVCLVPTRGPWVTNQ